MIVYSGRIGGSRDTKTVVPYARCADQGTVDAKRCESQLRTRERNKSAIPADALTNTFEEEIGAFHHASSKHDCVGRKERNEVGNSEAQVASLTVDSLSRQIYALPCQVANPLGG